VSESHISFSKGKLLFSKLLLLLCLLLSVANHNDDEDVVVALICNVTMSRKSNCINVGLNVNK
jgi:hypothetical protein